MRQEGASVDTPAYGILPGRLPTLACTPTAMFVLSTGYTCMPTTATRMSPLPVSPNYAWRRREPGTLFQNET